MTEQSAKQYEQRNLKTNEFVSFDETCHPPSRESNPTSHPPSRERSTPTRERNTTSQESNRSSRESTNPPSREGRRGRTQSIYSQHQSIKPLNMQSIIEAQKRISLNPAYMQMCKKLDKNALHEKLNDKVKLTKACHRPVTVPLVKIIGKIPDYVDVSELLGLRREVST